MESFRHTTKAGGEGVSREDAFIVNVCIFFFAFFVFFFVKEKKRGRFELKNRFCRDAGPRTGGFYN